MLAMFTMFNTMFNTTFTSHLYSFGTVKKINENKLKKFKNK